MSQYDARAREIAMGSVHIPWEVDDLVRIIAAAMQEAAEAERQACHEQVRLAVHKPEWHRSVGYCLGKVMFAIRARGAKPGE